MRKRFLSLFWLLAVAAPLVAAPAPKLVVLISIDQFRYDYLTRFRQEYHSGFARLLEHGAVFTNAYLDHYPTVTAIGHATMLTGSTPSIDGIVGNSWFDRTTGRAVTSVSDDSVPLLGAKPGAGSSPHNLLVSTVPDEWKMSGKGPSKAIGISMKDRAAILTVGRMADAAYWYDTHSGNFVSSGYYFDRIPGWVKAFNDSSRAEQFLGKSWQAASSGKSLLELPVEPAPSYYGALRLSPFGNELVREFAEAAVREERLGQSGGTDFLAVSFSANDYVGHRYGPHSVQVHELSVATGKTLGRFFEFLDQTVGFENTLVVVTADHGVSSVPEWLAKRGMAAGRIPEDTIGKTVDQALDARYGEADWVAGRSGPLPYLNHALIREKRLDLPAVRAVAANAVRNIPHVLRVYTYDQLANGVPIADHVDRRLRHGFFPARAADLFVVMEPHWIFTKSGTSHGSPHNYDAHVPVIFLGRWFRPGTYRETIVPNDIAPTLSAILEIETPSGSTGRVLTEALVGE